MRQLCYVRRALAKTNESRRARVRRERRGTAPPVTTNPEDLDPQSQSSESATESTTAETLVDEDGNVGPDEDQSLRHAAGDESVKDEVEEA